MKKFAKFLCLMMALVMSVMIVACGDKPDDGGNVGGDTVTLMVWVSKEDQAFARQVAEDFKKAHPEKKYNFLFGEQGENDAGTKVLNDPTNAPDVFSFPSDQMNKLLNGGALARIGGGRLERLKSVNSADAVDSATVKVKGEDQTYEDHTYAFPYTDNTFFLYYNKAKLSASDVTSIDSIIAKCGEGESFAYPMNDGWYSSAFFFAKGLGYNVTFDESFAETAIDTDFGNETGKQVVESMWKLVQNPHVKADSDDSKITAGFADGSIIAGVSGIWNKDSIEKQLGENMGVAKLPTYTYYDANGGTEQVQLVSFAGYKLMGVCNYSKVKADALDFAEFYTNRESQIKHFEARGFRPTDLEAQQDQRILNDACSQAIAAQLQHTKTQKNVPTTLWTPLQGLGDAMITAKTNNTAFDVVEQLNAAVTAIKKNANQNQETAG